MELQEAGVSELAAKSPLRFPQMRPVQDVMNSAVFRGWWFLSQYDMTLFPVWS